MKILRTRKWHCTGWGAPLAAAALVLALAAYLVSSPGAAPPQDYEALRLYTEALFEISQKYVSPKSEEDMIYGSLRGMMNSLDPDCSFLTAGEYQDYLEGKTGPSAEAGIELVYKDNLLTVASALDGGPASRAGLRPGDHILKINDQLVRNLTTQEGVRRFQGPPGTTLKLQVLRNALVKPLDLSVTLEPLKIGGTVTHQILKDSIGYIRIKLFTDNTPGELATTLKAVQGQQPPIKGLILDLRNNARGSLEQAVRTASVLLGEKEIVSARGRTAEGTQTYAGAARELALKTPLPLVVLTDQGTARAAEIVAGALKDQARAVLLGTKTLGLCGLTKALPLQDGSALVMTVAACYTPSGNKIQGKGLEPEVAGKAPPPGPPAPPEAAAPPAPDKDPWVLQAADLLKSGKAKPEAAKSQT
jgi:carboxyl-terminal processing protease